MRKQSDKSRLQDTSQDNCPGPFKNVKVKTGETGGGNLFNLVLQRYTLKYLGVKCRDSWKVLSNGLASIPRLPAY